ncbi:hypothetical protein HZC31_08125 [Candidatus Woesearchaeota archaeon]|nr:hypothetical protein [Candidatus Woesearchaeota archaeon]
MKSNETSKYLPIIVGIVAVIGIVVMILNSGLILNSTTVSGWAVSIAKVVNPTMKISCKDSDGGDDKYTKGETIGAESRGGAVSTFTDTCIHFTNTAEGVLEYYCEMGLVKSNDPVCSSNGCQNGACVR